ncbi:MAG: hypothetical protein K6D94_03755, partial [Clostridiales bacterium]|nr:hypothetical protein [Clostridiales bacterium]
GDSYYFILITYQYIKQSGDRSLLDAEASGMTVRMRLKKAFEAYCVDPETQLCFTEYGRRAVDWGFCDTMRKSGYLLMPSVLRANAAAAMADMTDDPEEKRKYSAFRERIKRSVCDILYDGDTGWLWSASEKCRQHDVWATAYAVYSGMLSGEKLEKTLSALAEGYVSGTAVRNGSVRHIKTDEDWSPESAWEDTNGIAKGTYQNGAWWPTATGWYIYSLWLKDTDLAVRCIRDHISYTESEIHNGAPCEWFDPDSGERSGLRYGTSAALPYAAPRRLAEAYPAAAEITADI